jgi:hypothetical protein
MSFFDINGGSSPSADCILCNVRKYTQLLGASLKVQEARARANGPRWNGSSLFSIQMQFTYAMHITSSSICHLKALAYGTT